MYQWTLLVSLGLMFACQESGVGDPCVPEDEYRVSFPGYSKDEVFTESRSYQCESRLCLVNKFQGRTSCPYGREKSGPCRTPDGMLPIEAPVLPQLESRPPEVSVYCSCRCSGPDPGAPYCECPNGYSCEELLPDVGLGNRQRAGGYCVRNGTEIPATHIPPTRCDPELENCGPLE